MSAYPDSPDIRGSLRAELVRDLAIGDLSHEQLGEKYDRVTQTISNFASRNKNEIRRAKQVQSDEYQGLAYAEKWQRIAFRERMLLDIEARLDDPDLTPTQRNRFSITADKLLHSIAEERGQLYARSALEVSMTGNPWGDVQAVAIDDDGNLHPVK